MRLRVLEGPYARPRSFAIYIITIDPLHHRSTYHLINPRESIAMTAPSSTEVRREREEYDKPCSESKERKKGREREGGGGGWGKRGEEA